MPSRAVSLIDLAVHELRTPLTVAIGSLRQVAAPIDPGHQAALARALRACERIERLAGEMRDWVRVEDTPPPAGPIFLAEAVNDAVAVASATRQGEVRLTLAAIPSVMVRGLPHLLTGALATLLSAVVRAADASAELPIAFTLTAEVVTVIAGPQVESAAPGVGGTFAAEWLGGLGFAVPLARAVVVGGGGAVASTMSPDGRLLAISVALAVARPTPSR